MPVDCRALRTLLCFVADDSEDAAGRNDFGRRGYNMGQQWPAGNFVQHLRAA